MSTEGDEAQPTREPTVALEPDQREVEGSARARKTRQQQAAVGSHHHVIGLVPAAIGDVDALGAVADQAEALIPPTRLLRSTPVTVVTVVANQAEVRVRTTIGGRPADQHDLAVSLNRQPLRPVDLAADGISHLAAGTETQVEAAVRVVARPCEIAIGRCQRTHGREARHDDLAVRLDGDAARVVCETRKVGGDPAAAAETRIERAVGIEAGECKVVLPAHTHETDDDDPAVSLDREALCGVEHAAVEGHGHHATRAEARVERAVVVEAQQLQSA